MICKNILAGLFRQEWEWERFPGPHSPAAPLALIVTLSNHVFQIANQSTSSFQVWKVQVPLGTECSWISIPRTVLGNKEHKVAVTWAKIWKQNYVMQTPKSVSFHSNQQLDLPFLIITHLCYCLCTSMPGWVPRDAQSWGHIRWFINKLNVHHCDL